MYINGTAPSKDERQHRLDLVEFGQRMHQQGFVSACDGNLSVRLEGNRILATPSGVSKGMMKPEQMVIVDLDGNHLGGNMPVSSEIQMHLTVYRERQDVHAVVHAHPVTATGFASAGMALDEVDACAFWQDSAIIWTLATSKLSPLFVPVSWTVWPLWALRSLVEPLSL